MSKVFAGGVSQSGLVLIRSYLSKYMPDAEIEELPVVGIKGKVRNQGKRPDIALIILDSSLYQQCVGVADDVLSLPKVHKYEDDELLEKFLMSKFGASVDSVSGSASKGRIEDNDSNTSSLRDELKKLTVIVQSKDATIDNLRNRIRELSLDNEDLNTYIDKISNLEKQISNLTSDKSAQGNSSVTIANLESKAKTLQTELDSIKYEYQKIKEEHSKCRSSDSEKMVIEINSLKTRITSLEEDLAESLREKKSLEDSVSQLENAKLELSKKCASLENSEGISAELQTKLDVSNASISVLTSENEELKNELDLLKEELKMAKDSLLSSENVVKTLTEEISRVSDNDSSTQLSVDLSKAKDTISSLTESLNLAKEDVKSKEGSIKELMNKIALLENELSNKSDEISKLTLNVSGLQVELDSANSKDFDGLLDKYNSLKEQLRESEEKLSDADKKYSLAMIDLKSLQNKINASSFSDVEFEALKAQCKEQESELDELNDFLNDIKVSPYFAMNNYALPKVAMQLSLDVNVTFKKSKFILLSTGSGESASSMYSVIKERCSKSKKSFLVVDLVTESYIDTSVGLSSNITAYNWLSGGDVISCIADTKLKNVSVVTTGIGYMNDLFFLSVDWSSRLSLLDGLADIILFNIGCLDSPVRTTLFNSFIGLCSISNIFVKASPTNLRTTLNHLGSIVNLGVSKVVCLDSIDIQKGTQKILLDKISSKCPSVVYSNSINLGW